MVMGRKSVWGHSNMGQVCCLGPWNRQRYELGSLSVWGKNEILDRARWKHTKTPLWFGKAINFKTYLRVGRRTCSKGSTIRKRDLYLYLRITVWSTIDS